ncbi:MAG: polyprenol monophosphomannose synthase [Elusimicrobia bacterium]|nr:polyprenol monophosphomannose synthase [Elusimicrobiota bacterium]
MKSLVIIPTYNEKGNIEKIIGRVSELGFYILVIDDNSPDGTGKILDRLQMTNDSPRSSESGAGKLQIIHREAKLGLGTAYIQGFKWALERDFDCIFTMDADFSHSPECLPEFLKKLTDFDLIVGSRYVPGGGVRNWPIRRKIISRCGNMYAKTILRFHVNDCTAGFMGFRRKVLEKIDLDGIKSEGYGFLIEMKYRTYKLGYKIFEYPIIFTNRTLGKSKISKNIIWEAIFLVWKLKLRIK